MISTGPEALEHITLLSLSLLGHNKGHKGVNLRRNLLAVRQALNGVLWNGVHALRGPHHEANNGAPGSV